MISGPDSRQAPKCEVVHETIPDGPAVLLNSEQAPLVARSVTPPSPPTSPSETMERGDDTVAAACTSRYPVYRVLL